MTENKKLTEKRDGQNTIPLRQDGKTKWVLASAGMGKASTQFLYGTHADRLAEYEAIGTVEECRTAVERMKPKKATDIVMAKDRKICVGRIGKCPCCGSIVAEDNFTCEDCFQVLDWSE